METTWSEPKPTWSLEPRCQSTTLNVPQVSWHTTSNIQPQEGAAWALARRDTMHEFLLGLFMPGVQGIFSVFPCICQSRMHTGSVCHSHHKSASHTLCPWCFWISWERIAGKNCLFLLHSALTCELCHYFFKWQKSSQWFVAITAVQCMPKCSIYPYRRKQKPIKLVLLPWVNSVMGWY